MLARTPQDSRGLRETSPGDRFDLSSATDGGLPSSEATPPALPGPRSIGALLPIMGVVLVAFLVIGMALPVLPLHVHQGLGLSAFVGAGLVFAGLSDWCGMGLLLARMPWNRAPRSGAANDSGSCATR